MSDHRPHNFRLMLVDDDNGIRSTLSLVLRDEGYKVCNAESGAQALRLMAQQPVDLVVSDMHMPDGDGLFLLESIRNSDCQISGFILMSGFNDVSPEEARSRGADRFFRKPCKVEELLTAIREILTLPVPQPPDNSSASAPQKPPA